VLGEMGLDAARIAALRASGVLWAGPKTLITNATPVAPERPGPDRPGRFAWV